LDPAADLFNALVRPLAGSLHGADGMVFVPDKLLHGLPFGALYDRAAATI
jgi:CHAT domain-containing protein